MGRARGNQSSVSTLQDKRSERFDALFGAGRSSAAPEAETSQPTLLLAHGRILACWLGTPAEPGNVAFYERTILSAPATERGSLRITYPAVTLDVTLAFDVVLGLEEQDITDVLVWLDKLDA